jgi:transposase-like protein
VRLDQLKLGLGKQLPEAMACLIGGFAAATQFYAFPKAHWRRIRSNNGLERLNGEIKRRIRVVGAFPDRASALRLITAVSLHVTAIWSDRRYLDMSEEINRKAA